MSLPPKPTVSIAHQAKLRSDGYVALDLIVDGQPVTGIVHRSRSAGAPNAPSHELEAAALHFTATYVEANPLLFHELFTQGALPHGQTTSLWLDQSDGSLGFKLIVDGVECRMGVSTKLQMRSVGSMVPRNLTDEDLYTLLASAYDVCLAYMKDNLDAIEAIGFDASELRRQRAEIAGRGTGA
jgi:hypothetical protein